MPRTASHSYTFPIQSQTGGLCIDLSQGEAVAGNIGSPTYMSCTMIGDTVNVAARLVPLRSLTR